jgi:uncharacterized protein YjbI with pentapeptide repeats/TolA-binding protein
MSNPSHLAKLLQGAEAWNLWRADNPDLVPDLSGAEMTPRAGIPHGLLSGNLDLSGADMQGADLVGTDLTGANLRAADLTNADLRYCDLTDAELVLSNLSGANLGGARLTGTDFSGARLDGTWLHYANLSSAIGLAELQVGAALYGDGTVFPSYLAMRPLEHGDDLASSEEAGLLDADDGLAVTDAYALLGVSPMATAKEIREAYRKLAKKYHPDLNPGDPNAVRRFARLNEAQIFALAASNLSEESGRRYSEGGNWVRSAALLVVALALPALGIYWQARSPGDGVEIVDARSVSIEKQPRLPLAERMQAVIKAATAPITPDLEETREHSGDAILAFAAPALPNEEDEGVLQTAAIPTLQPEATAQQRQSEWETLRLSTDLRALQDFIQRNPERTETDEAREQFGSALASTRDANALRRLARDLPAAAPEAALVNQRLAALVQEDRHHDDAAAWYAAKDAGTIAAYRAYLMDYPGGIYAESAGRRLASLQAEIVDRRKDDAAWARAVRMRTPGAYREYLAAFADGAHAHAAERALAKLGKLDTDQKREDETWSGVTSTNTRDAFLSYLKAYPKGRYAAAAKERLASAEATAKPTPSTTTTASQQPRPEPHAQRAMRFPSSDEPFVEPIPRRD